MRIFKQRATDAPRYTTRYTGITEGPDGGGFQELSAEVEAPREIINPDVTPEWDLGHMGSEQFFTHMPAVLSSLKWTRGSGGPSYEGVEAVRRDAKKEYGSSLEGPGGKSGNTTIGEIEPNVVSKDDISLMELDPEVSEVSMKKEMADRHPLIQKLASNAANSTLSQQFYQPRLPGM